MADYEGEKQKSAMIISWIQLRSECQKFISFKHSSGNLFTAKVVYFYDIFMFLFIFSGELRSHNEKNIAD